MPEVASVQVEVSPEIYLMQIKKLQERVNELESQNRSLGAQARMGQDLIGQLLTSKSNMADTQPPKQKKEKRKPRDETYSEYKSDGKLKAHAADSIRSYSDFKAIQDYFLAKGRVRDWMMWTVGVSLGLRVSDLLSLKWRNVIEDDKVTIRKRIEIYEKKTGKLNNLLITEAVKKAISRYLVSINYTFDLDGYLFASRKTGGKMYEEHGWRILSRAGRELGLPIVVGSHTMRKSFANIAACVDRSTVDMNSITKVQGLLNHSDQKVTMRYLGTYQEMFDRARVAVSDFVLGKTGIDRIIAGSQHTVDDIMDRLEALENALAAQR